MVAFSPSHFHTRVPRAPLVCLPYASESEEKWRENRQKNRRKNNAVFQPMEFICIISNRSNETKQTTIFIIITFSFERNDTVVPLHRNNRVSRTKTQVDKACIFWRFGLRVFPRENIQTRHRLVSPHRKYNNGNMPVVDDWQPVSQSASRRLEHEFKWKEKEEKKILRRHNSIHFISHHISTNNRVEKNHNRRFLLSYRILSRSLHLIPIVFCEVGFCW